jgi:hypothetical protein
MDEDKDQQQLTQQEVRKTRSSRGFHLETQTKEGKFLFVFLLFSEKIEDEIR